METRALSWAAAGWPVFPVAPATKRPAVKGWQEWATTDPDRIRDWWSRHPDSIVGIALRSYSVIDLDTKAGPACEEWASLEDIHGATPTWMQQTRSGGWHLFYRGTLPNTVRKLASCIDTRGDGGLVVAYSDMPPDPLLDVADMPIWLPTALPARERIGQAADIELDRPINLARARELIKRAPGAMQGQGRNNATYELAASLHDIGIAEDTAAELMLSWNERCIPPRDDDEFRSIVEHAYQYAQNVAGARAAIGEWGDIPDDQQPNPPAQPFHWWHEIAAREYPTPKWLWQGRFLLNHANLLTGDGGHGKTTLALNLAVSVATGSILLGEPCAKLPVLILSGEDGEGIIRDHCRAIAHTLGVADGELDKSLAVRSVLSDPVEAGHLLTAIDDAGGYSATEWGAAIETFIAEVGECLVIIDPLIEFVRFNHLSDDACRALVTKYLARLTRLGATVLVSDHISRAGQREGHGYTGSVQLKAAFPVLATLKAEEWQPGSVPQKRLSLRFVKVRYGREHTLDFWRIGDSPAFSLEQSSDVQAIAERVYMHIRTCGKPVDAKANGLYGAAAVAWDLTLTEADVTRSLKICRDKNWLVIKRENSREIFAPGQCEPACVFS